MIDYWFPRTTSTKFSRQDVRNSLHSTDADGIEFRSIKRIKRREYSVAGLHYLWHHKRIRYGIVCHGCIDGFSRTVIYLTSSDSNKACTHLESFLLGTMAYRHSLLRVSSKHNIRIERLWQTFKIKLPASIVIYFVTLKHPTA